MSKYLYKGKSPLQYGELFIDNFLANNTVDDFETDDFKKYGVSDYINIPTYIKGVFLFGIEKIYRQNRKEQYGKFISDWLDRVLDENKKLKQIEGHTWASLISLDFRQPGLMLFRQYEETGNIRYLNAIGELCESLFADYPKTSNGILWHNKVTTPNQVWVDGLYMAGPLCAGYARMTGKEEFARHAIDQAIKMYEFMHDEKDGLMFHGWDESRTAVWADSETGLSAEKWGRGLGWYVVAVTEIIDILGKDYEGIDELIRILKQVLAALMKVQRQEDGYWCQIIDKPNAEGNWRETSATCLITMAIAKAYRLGIVDERYLVAARKAFEGVIDSIREDESGSLVLGEVCKGTNVGSNYQYYSDRPKCENDRHGTGAFLQMCAELNLCQEE